jgi:hypothetical protein
MRTKEDNTSNKMVSAFPSSLQISIATVLLMGALAYWHSDNRLSVILIAFACAAWYVISSNQQTRDDAKKRTDEQLTYDTKDIMKSQYVGKEPNVVTNKHISLKLRSELFNMISRLGRDKALRLSVCCPNRLQNAIGMADDFFRAADSILGQKNKKRGKKMLRVHLQTLRDMRNGALNAFHGMHFVLQADRDIRFLHKVVKTLRIETLNTLMAVVSSFGGSSVSDEYTASTPISSIMGAALPLDHMYDGRELF